MTTSRTKTVFRLQHAGTLALTALVGATPGCALSWYDPATRTQHLIGVGHLTVSLPDSGSASPATLCDIRAAGLVAATDQFGSTLTLGIHHQQRAWVHDPEQAAVFVRSVSTSP